MKTRFVTMPPMVLLALSAAFPSPASAQSTLEPVVVTATRSPSRADEVLGDVTVISREDIERGGGRTLAEVIARSTGVQTASNGALGKSSSLFIRGTDSRHVLFLIDGVRYSSATAGTPPLDSIALEEIDRIEVLKGPASALYGSDAVGGVVQVFTRRGEKGLHPHASVTLGSEGRREATAGLRGGGSDARYAIGVQRLREKGISATNPAVGSSHNPDRDGFSQSSFNASGDWTFAPGWKLDANLLYSTGTNHYDSGAGGFDTRADIETRVYGVGVEGQILPAWKSRLSFGVGEDLQSNMTGTPPSDFNTRQDQWTWLNERSTPLGKLVVGLERVTQRVSGTTAYTVSRRENDSVFAGLSGEAGRHSWQVNARHDDDSQFGDADTGLLSYGFRFTPAWRGHVSYGTTFKAPSFNTLYFPGFGNPTTQPERGRSTEAGLAYVAGRHAFKLIRFDNRIRNFITLDPVVVNVPRTTIEGWTLSWDGQAGNWSFRTAVDWLDARNAANGRKLVRRADEQLTAGVDYSVDGWRLGATLLAVGERFDNAANTVQLPGFATADLHADYALSKAWTLQARLNNLAGKTYQTANGYNQPGRAAYLTLRWQPR